MTTYIMFVTLQGRTGTVLDSTLATTGRWDADYNLDIVDWLKANGLAETPKNVRRAMAELEMRRAARTPLDHGVARFASEVFALWCGR